MSSTISMLETAISPSAVPEARDWYFAPFEARRPPPPVAHSAARELAWQTLAVMAVALGGWYLYWRWTSSLNTAALWFAIPLVVAETLAFIGSILFFLSVWRTSDTPPSPPPASVNAILDKPQPQDRPLIVDVFFPTYNEDVELVRLSIRDAKALKYPHPVDVRIHVLDDGRRAAMRAVADQEGVGYMSRTTNVGYKAGNLRNGLEQTQGDLLVICDADTRVFPEMLEETLGYFRDPRVAWVQTPQWFYDLDEGLALPEWLARRARAGAFGRLLGRAVQRVVGPITVGSDPFANHPQMFYDVIQRRRNWCNAAFCCGAGSIHRREAVMEAALKGYAQQLDLSVPKIAAEIQDPEMRLALESAMAGEAARDLEFTPYKFHVSEDIYTSIVLHSDPERQWRSVYHPRVLSRMLSPQDLLAWTIQRFKYAGGTLDIFWNDNPLRRKGLSAWQRLSYGTTIWSYFSPFWTVLFLLAPPFSLITGITPLAAYDKDFLAHFVPFVLANKLAFVVGTWGVNTWRGEQYYLGFFWLNLKALADVFRGRPVKFHVTPKTRDAGTFLPLVWPHLAVMALGLLGALVGGLRVAFGGDPGSYVANLFWTASNTLSLSAIVAAAVRRPTEA